MIIDMDKTVSMTEANQNFSKVARMAMEYGDVTILKNNKVFLTVHYAPQDDSVKAASDADVLASSAKLHSAEPSGLRCVSERTLCET